MLLDVSDVESSLVVHGQSPASDVVDDRFSASCATSTRPPGHSTIYLIADDETDRSLGRRAHLSVEFQLIRSISFSVATGQHSATGVTPFPFHDAVIPPVSDDHRALLIDMETERVGRVGGWPPLRPCPPATVTPFCAHRALSGMFGLPATETRRVMVWKRLIKRFSILSGIASIKYRHTDQIGTRETTDFVPLEVIRVIKETQYLAELAKSPGLIEPDLLFGAHAEKSSLLIHMFLIHRFCGSTEKPMSVNRTKEN